MIPIQRILDHFSNSIKDPLQFIEKLNIPSDISMNTAAHYAVFGGHLRNFEVLMQHETDIWKPNFRGVRPFDVYSRIQNIGTDFRKIQMFNVVSVRDKLKKYYMHNILFGCKVQSLVNKELAGERGQLVDLVEKNGYELGEELRSLKFNIDKKYKNFFENAKNELSSIQNYLAKANVGNFGIKPTQKKAMFQLFNKVLVEKEPRFKYTKGEIWEKKELLNMIDDPKEIDFSQPLNSNIKNSYNMRQAFCIEVATNSEEGNKSILYEQLMNIKSKYQKYGGGIKIDIYDAFIDKPMGFFYKCLTCFVTIFFLRRLKGVDNYIKNNFGTHKFFYLISLSEDLLSKLASDMRLETYDMKEDFHTTYHVPEKKDVNSNNKKNMTEEKERRK